MKSFFVFAFFAAVVSASPAQLEERAVSHHKVGISADWGSPKAAVSHFKNNHTAGHYNWSPWKFDNLPKGVDFWPMLHGEESIKDWAHVKKGYAKTAMGCNEVNQAGQSKMTVARGAQIWKLHLLPLAKQGYRLVSHSTNQAADGLAWQKAWRKACPDCHKSVWAYSVHWYGTDANAFKKYVSDFHKAVGKPIVVTEFACTDFSNQKKCDAKKAQAFMDNVTTWMNGQDFVKAYFWFGMWPSNGMPGGVQPGNSLVNSNGTPNSLGKHYISR